MIRRIAIIASAAAIAVTSLTACGAGNSPQTSKSKGSVQGTSQDKGSIAIRNAAIVTDGTDAYVQMTLINSGSQADELTSIVTSAAPKAVVSDSASKQLLTVALPSNVSVAFTNKGTTIDLQDPAKGTVSPQVGSLVSLSLSFKLAGDVTLQVPVLDYKSLTQ